MLFLCFKQKTAYEMRISDWSSDVCSSDLFGSQLRDLEVARSRHRRFDRVAIDAVGVDRPRSGQADLVEPGHGDHNIEIVVVAARKAEAIALAADRQLRAIDLDLEPVEHFLQSACDDRDRTSTRLNYSHQCASR